MISKTQPTYLGFRPSETRKIKKQYISYRGVVKSTKLRYSVKEEPVLYPYESEIERDFFFILDHDLHCLEFLPQAIFSVYDDKNNLHRYAVDTWAVFYVNNHFFVYIFEVKAKKQLEKLQATDPSWQLRALLLQSYCTHQNQINYQEKKNISWRFRIVTEEDTNCICLENITYFRPSALIPPSDHDIYNIKEIINKIFTDEVEYNYNDLFENIKKNLVSETFYLEESQIKTILNYLIFYQYLIFDWDEKFSESNVNLKLNLSLEKRFLPFFEFKQEKKEAVVFESEQIFSEIDVGLIKKELTKKAEFRLSAIKPLIEKKEDKKLSLKDVEEQSLKCNVPVSTIYNWMKKYEDSNNDWKSLIDLNHKKGNYSTRIDDEINEILFKHLHNECSCCTILMTIKSKFFNIKLECETNHLLPPSYATIYRKFKNLKATERKGKQGGLIEHEMQQSIHGQLPRGEYPLDLIQIDSTWLDIFVLNPIEQKPKRPFITIFLDTKTRMIYSWWMTLREQSSVDINRGLMRGFLSKEDLLKQFEIDESFPIYGIPNRVQFDNAKIFDTKFVKEFCFKYGINDYQFRMIKRPDKGGYVERMFGTINRSWLSHLPGYAPPLKSRPSEYRPEKDKNLLSFHIFEKWFIQKIIIYHSSPHEGLRRDIGHESSPLAVYNQNMEGRRPRLPKNPELLQFEILKFKKSKLTASGIQQWNNRYNTDGGKGFLKRIRERQQGLVKKILWRYDPEDITQIWVYDDMSENPFYFNVKISGGPLYKFVEKNPNIKVGLNDFRNIWRNLQSLGTKISNDSEELLKNLEMKNLALVQANKNSNKSLRNHAVTPINQNDKADVIKENRSKNISNLLDELEIHDPTLIYSEKGAERLERY